MLALGPLDECFEEYNTRVCAHIGDTNHGVAFIRAESQRAKAFWNAIPRNYTYRSARIINSIKKEPRLKAVHGVAVHCGAPERDVAFPPVTFY